MAKVYSAPVDPPVVDYTNYDMATHDKQEREYLDKLATLARQNGKSPLLGKEIRWQRGDGYARYLVWNTKPLELIWLELGDAWDVEEPLIRGLRVSDVKEMVERSERLRAIFSKSTT
jgi:hypothetical protein